MTYGLVGSAPVAQHNKLLNTILMDSIKAAWPSYCTDPPVSAIGFWDVDAPNFGEINLAFEQLPDVRPIEQRPLGWYRITIIGYVNIHVYVGGNTVETQPVNMIKVINALENIIEAERSNLVPHSQFVTIDRIIPVDKEEPNQTTWHQVVSVFAKYQKTLG